METEKHRKTLDYLDGYLHSLEGKRPIAYKNMLEKINVQRINWPPDLIVKVDSRLRKYENEIKGKNSV